MKHFETLIEEKIKSAFKKEDLDEKYGNITVSKRPDLCEYQCSGAMAVAKITKENPIDVANRIVEHLKKDEDFENVEAVKPGFINFNISKEFIKKYLENMALLGAKNKFGFEDLDKRMTIIDYGGANVAKPLHVGHLRSAVIGESIKRILKYAGNTVYGDVHLGDYGLQMGLIIEQLRIDKPELLYFNEEYVGEYPEEPPFTLDELENIYPRASKKSKEDEAFLEVAQNATLLLQKGYKPYVAIWEHIMRLSKADLKKNYDRLLVEFDIWKGEADAAPYIEDMIDDLKARNIAFDSRGATVIDVSNEDDKKEIPPCIIQKSDGAALYATSDLATIVARKKEYNPQRYVYVADKRQELYFTQVFRSAKKASYVNDEELTFVGFGTMNGKDGKPFKTRDGGVMRLENLFLEIEEAIKNKVDENGERNLDEKAREKIVVAALKYGDLSNAASRDYVFDIERFTSFEGNTGPYILYTQVRINSILDKYFKETDKKEISFCLQEARTKKEKDLSLKLVNFSSVIESSIKELAPHRICQYLYDIADIFNGFYHDTKILLEEDEKTKESYISLLLLTKDIINQCLELLAIECPDRM